MTRPGDDPDRPLRFGEARGADDDRAGVEPERARQWGQPQRRDEPAPQPSAWTGDSVWSGSAPSAREQAGQQGRWSTPSSPAGDDAPRWGGAWGSPAGATTRPPSEGFLARLGTRDGMAGLLFAVGWLVAGLGLIAAIAALTITETGTGFVIESFARDLVLGLGLGAICLALSQLLRTPPASAASDDRAGDAAGSSGRGPGGEPAT